MRCGAVRCVRCSQYLHNKILVQIDVYYFIAVNMFHLIEATRCSSLVRFVQIIEAVGVANSNFMQVNWGNRNEVSRSERTIASTTDVGELKK